MNVMRFLPVYSLIVLLLAGTMLGCKRQEPVYPTDKDLANADNPADALLPNTISLTENKEMLARVTDPDLSHLQPVEPEPAETDAEADTDEADADAEQETEKAGADGTADDADADAAMNDAEGGQATPPPDDDEQPDDAAETESNKSTADEGDEEVDGSDAAAGSPNP